MNNYHQNKFSLPDFFEINWEDIWSEQTLLNRKCQNDNEFVNFWSSKEKAREFWSKIKSQMWFYDTILNQVVIHPGDRVLDIGGGPGTIAIPLARKGTNVTVIEPAKGMVAVLSENIRDENISNIRIIQEKWEDITKEQLGESYDHIIACFSLGMTDIIQSIKKMISVSRGKIYLIWFSGLSSWDQMMKEICSGICGSRYYSGPKSELLYLVLNQMKIYPDILNVRQVFSEQYESFDSTVFHILERCKMSYPGKEDFVKGWVRERLTEENGHFVWKTDVTVSIIKWDNSIK